MSQKSLKDIFELNRNHLLIQIEKYISNINQTKETCNNPRKHIKNYIIQEKFSQAITLLEELREYKQGIGIYKLFTPHFPPIVIRDARKCGPNVIRSTESFEIQYLNLIRSSFDIIKIENKMNFLPQIIQNAIDFIDDFHYQNLQRSQEDIKHNFQTRLKDLVLILENVGIKDALHKIDISKDFQNFNDIHADVVTISSLEEANKNYIVFEAEVALRGLTTNQLQEYRYVLECNDNEPEWYKSLPIWEQELCKKYAPTIIQGTHVISSQLTQIVGMRNAFEKITGIVKDTAIKNLELKILHQSKHSGCLASFSRHEKSRQYIANLNAEQAQEWVGSSVTLHCNTYTSGPNSGKENDKKVVTQTIKAMDHIKGMVTNTAYDSYRKYAGANFYNGINQIIDKISNALPKSKYLDSIKLYLKSQKKKDKCIPKNKIKNYLKLLHDNSIIDVKIHNVLNILIDIKNKIKMSEKGSPGFLNMEISTNLNILLNLINNMIQSANFKERQTKDIPRQEILNMCILGLDRTGFSEHIQSTKSLESIILKEVTYLDSKIIAGGHTSQIAGATYFGGGSIGCYGIKSDSIVYFPKKRAKTLSSLLEVSASGSKLHSVLS